jgi:hypothetical protein
MSTGLSAAAVAAPAAASCAKADVLANAVTITASAAIVLLLINFLKLISFKVVTLYFYYTIIYLCIRSPTTNGDLNFLVKTDGF